MPFLDRGIPWEGNKANLIALLESNFSGSKTTAPGFASPFHCDHKPGRFFDEFTIRRFRETGVQARGGRPFELDTVAGFAGARPAVAHANPQ
jgi:hypothetical protein